MSRAAISAGLILSFATAVSAVQQAARPEVSGPAREKSRKRGIDWVKIPGGTFRMGWGAEDSWVWARPIHQVKVKPFLMAKTLVTVAQYKACVDAGACIAPDPGDYCNWGVQGKEKDPINCVDWYQAKAFSAWVGGRLPTEAEWEYAARSGGKDRRYPWGNGDADCEKAVISGCGIGTRPVCSRPAGNTEQGLCDMAGNVWEWVQDWFLDTYNGAPSDGSARDDPIGSSRVSRGGSWNFDVENARSARRGYGDPGFRISYFGFRPARDR